MNLNHNKILALVAKANKWLTNSKAKSKETFYKYPWQLQN